MPFVLLASRLNSLAPYCIGGSTSYPGVAELRRCHAVCPSLAGALCRSVKLPGLDPVHSGVLAHRRLELLNLHLEVVQLALRHKQSTCSQLPAGTAMPGQKEVQPVHTCTTRIGMRRRQQVCLGSPTWETPLVTPALADLSSSGPPAYAEPPAREQYNLEVLDPLHNTTGSTSTHVKWQPQEVCIHQRLHACRRHQQAVDIVYFPTQETLKR